MRETLARWPGRLPILGLLALLAAPALAQPTPRQPTPAEAQHLQSCIAAAWPSSAANITARCMGGIAAACLREPDAPRLPQPAGRAGFSALDCVAVETAAWDERLNRWFRAALPALSPAGQERLRAAQRGWITFRDSDCELERIVEVGTVGDEVRGGCLMGRTAQRAAELELLADRLERRP